jgi:hypothetical protein
MEIKEVHEFMEGISPFFPGWKIDPKYNSSYWCHRLIGPNDMGLFFNFTKTKGKVDVCGSWPQNKEYEEFMPNNPLHIGISMSKSFESIASDIKKRLMPWYEENFKAQLQLMEEVNKRLDIFEEVIKKVEEVSKSKRHPNYNKNTVPFHYGEANVSHDTTQITLKFNWVPTELALQLIDLYINNYQKYQKPEEE